MLAISHCLSFSLTLHRQILSTCARKVWAKVNKVPSKTFHFPCHLLTTRVPKHTPPPSPNFSLISLSFSSRRKHVFIYAAKLQSTHEQDATTWLFRGLKLVMTLKCRVRLQFFKVQWFYVPCVTLFGAKIPLPYSLPFSPSNFFLFDSLLKKLLSCYRERQLTLLAAV